MSINRLTLADVLRDHVTLELECIDRMYLNVYIPRLQHESGASWFLKQQRHCPVASSAAMAPISRAFIGAIDDYIETHHVPVITFTKGTRKDDVVAPYVAAAAGQDRIVLIGKAQEKTTTYRTTQGRGPRSQDRYPRLFRSTAMVNQYYFYGVDRDFGPFFIKFSSYFPYTAKFCLNGHEYLKRQLTLAKVAFEPLDNGVRSCANPDRMQSIASELSADKIEALVRKWLARLPQPFTAADRAAGYDYDISVLQAEFALTQVLDRPLMGRIFFEEAIREHLDLGRPEQVQLIFERRTTRATPSRYRTRVITEGVTPALHVDYKHSRIKQYHKESLAALCQIDFQANRRLLHVQTLSHDCLIGEDAFQQLNQPGQVAGQRVAGLRFADPRVQALLSTLVAFRLLPQGFANHDLRVLLAPLLGLAPDQLTPGQMTYHLRRLRLHGLIQRIPSTHRYEVTAIGHRMALFCTRVYNRVLRPGLSQIAPGAPPGDARLLQKCYAQLEVAMDDWIANAALAS